MSKAKFILPNDTLEKSILIDIKSTIKWHVVTSTCYQEIEWIIFDCIIEFVKTQGVPEFLRNLTVKV